MASSTEDFTQLKAVLCFFDPVGGEKRTDHPLWAKYEDTRRLIDHLGTMCGTLLGASELRRKKFPKNYEDLQKVQEEVQNTVDANVRDLFAAIQNPKTAVRKKK